MDYTVRAIRFHLIGAAALCGVCLAFMFSGSMPQEPTAAMGYMVSVGYWLILAWWGLGIFMIRPVPRAWATRPLQAARHATRILWGCTVALMATSLVMVAARYTYSGLLGATNIYLDGLTACGAILAGQAVGCAALKAPSRPKPYLAASLMLLVGMTAGIIYL